MLAKANDIRGAFSRFLQYLYFLRIPLLGYFALPALCVLDWRNATTAITRGIMTTYGSWQAFHAAFFVTAQLMTVLICARNIVKNGPVRFGDAKAPEWLCEALTRSDAKTMWRTLAVAHIPTAFTLWYVIQTTLTEDEALKQWGAPQWGWYVFATLAGLAAAFLFWYLVSLFYLWTYPNDAERQEPSALLFPTLPLFAWARDAEMPRVAKWLETVAGAALRLTHTGYAAADHDPIWELHFLSTVALGAFLLLYFFLYPLIAPVVVTTGVKLDVVLAIVVAVAFVVGSFNQKKQHGEPRGVSGIGRLFSLIMVALLGVFLSFYFTDQSQGRVLMEMAFPTLGSVLVILVFFQWLLSGMSFFFDRYRVPVLTACLLLVSFLHALPSDQEHYFAANGTPHLEQSAVDSPFEVVQRRQAAQSTDDRSPFVVVTASGGGIQAAEWTAQVMAEMEKRFRDDAELGDYRLHDHLLLVSSVSGGSVGMMPYLLEYTADPAQLFRKTPDDELTQRLTRAPGCSSLEAVAWGLEYYDLQKLLLPLRFSWHQKVQGKDAPDRTWALGEAFNRNLQDENCQTGEYVGQSGKVLSAFPNLPAVKSGGAFTLTQAVALEQQQRMPAFAFNTTVAETGGRFLLSNYVVPAPPQVVPALGKVTAWGSDFLPAESFLQAYAMETIDSLKGKQMFADVSLAVAARLGATFPYVSSATRIPRRFVPGPASHFLDGGYFDNDGTATATEFLYSAMQESMNAGALKETKLKPMKVLLVEIRDGSDLNPNSNLDDLAHQTGDKLEPDAARPKSWGTAAQLGAPLGGLWKAGHESITRRNRRELCVLEKAYGDDLEIYHLVFAIPAEPAENSTKAESQEKRKQERETEPNPVKTPPLSWKLTPSQQSYIERTVHSEATQEEVAAALQWVKTVKSGGKAESANTCKSLDELDTP